MSSQPINEHSELHQYLLDVLEHMTDAFFVLDRNWRFTYLNRQAEHLLQRSGADLIGKDVWEIFPQVVGSVFYQQFQEAAASGKAVHFEALYAPSEIWLHVHAYPSEGSLAVHATDITEQKRAEEAYRESERRFQAVWEAASDAMALSTPDGIVLAANPAYFQLYGYSPGEVIGQDFSLIFLNTQRQWAQELYAYIFQSPTVGPPVETAVVRADGTERIVESSYSFLIKDGIRTAMLSIVRDITERKKTEETLRESELKLNMALELASLGTWDWDIVSNTICLSANLEATLGFAPRTIMTYETFLGLVHPEDRSMVEQAVRGALEDGADYEIEFRVIRPDGVTRWTKARGEVLYDDADKPICVIGITMDITKRKHVG